MQSQATTSERSDFGNIIGWGNFYQIHADEVYATEATQDFMSLPVSQATRSWCTSPRCIGRVKAVDVERQVRLGVFNDLFYCSDDS